MARKNSGFTSDERGIENSMAMPETSPRPLSQMPFDRTLEKLNSADRREAAEREERIAEQHRQPRPPMFRWGYDYEVWFREQLEQEREERRMAATRVNLPKSRTQRKVQKPHIPHRNRLVGVNPVHVGPWQPLKVVNEYTNRFTGRLIVKMERPPYDHFQWPYDITDKVDALESRVEEQILSHGKRLEQSKQHRHIINSSTIPPAPAERHKTLPIVGRRMQLAFGGMSRVWAWPKVKGFPLNRHLKLYAEDTRWGKRNGKRRDVRHRSATYRGEIRHAIRVDGQLFTT